MKRERGEQSKENRKGLRGLTVACKYSHLMLGESPKISVCNSSQKFHTDDFNLPQIQASLPNGYSTPLLL